MEYLKIKDGVDLKELEKFGFKKKVGLYERDIDNVPSGRLVIEPSRTIVIWDDGVCGTMRFLVTDNYKKFIKDLIQANLTETVVEKC